MHNLGPGRARRAGGWPGRVCAVFLLNLVFTRNTIHDLFSHGSMDRTGSNPRWIEPRDACNIET